MNDPFVIRTEAQNTLWRLDAWTVALGSYQSDRLQVSQIAGPGVRCLAGLVDFALQFAVGLVMILWVAIQAPRLVPAGSGWWFFPSAAIEWHVLYFLLFESFTGGITPGKRLMKIHVVDASSRQRITPWQSIARNFSRLIDLLPLAYFAALVSMFCGRGRRRLGDRLAKTLVVSALPLATQLDSARVAESLYAASPDGYMLESYIQRRTCMDPALAEGLDEKVAAWFHESCGTPDRLTTQAWVDGKFDDYLQALYLYEKSLAGDHVDGPLQQEQDLFSNL